jgi:hypothetical protein
MTQAAALANGDPMSAAELAIEGSSPEMREPEAYRGQQHDGDHVNLRLCACRRRR